MNYDENKLLAAKLFWYSFKLTGYGLKRALYDTSCLQSALNNKRPLDLAQSQLLIHATARQYSEKELADVIALYERVTKGKYSADIVNAILGIKEKED